MAISGRLSDLKLLIELFGNATIKEIINSKAGLTLLKHYDTTTTWTISEDLCLYR